MKSLDLLEFYFGYKEKSKTDQVMEALGELFSSSAPFIISSIALVIIIGIIYGVVAHIKQSRMEKICVATKVVEKISKPSKSDPYNYIVFEKENGERLSFIIHDNNVYATIVIGDKGLLTFQGQAFVDFVRTNQ